jgi:ElaB/YqjD/DUF883 family membrane-anchored ribosome-binding protein
MINRMMLDSPAPPQADAIDIPTRSAGARQGMGPLWRRAQAAVTDNPKTSLIAAAAAGVLLGWIIKRR